MPSDRISICAVLTVYNRREKTLQALQRFFDQEGSFDLAAVLMDDGSTDGTGEAVLARFPRVRMLRGDGSLFWNGGMARAYAEARREEADYFLWLNDDTLLSPGALQSLVEDAGTVASAKGCIVVGSVVDPADGSLTYGGKRRVNRWNPVLFATVQPAEDKVLPCQSMNGNVVLIDSKAARILGGLDKRFTHSMGDYDYGFRAGDAGIPVVVGRGFHGECPRNPVEAGWSNAGSVRQRLRRVNSPKGLPMKEWALFLRKHGNIFWPVTWLITYRRILTG